jgi:signal transduction histidine kinase
MRVRALHRLRGAAPPRGLPSRIVLAVGAMEAFALATSALLLKASCHKLHLAAQEQRALRRIATLIARGASPAEVFTAVAAEAGHVLGAKHTTIVRYEPDDTVTVVGYWNDPRAAKVMPPLNGHWPVEEGTLTAAVLTTGRPAQKTDYEHATSAIGIWSHSQGLRCVVGSPVKLEGRVWGAMFTALVTGADAEVTEDRMCEFVELVSTAIANAQARSDLLTSRARIIAAADESRQRIERNLHDGAQQRLVTLGLKLRMMQTSVPLCQEELKRELSVAVEELSGVLADVQEISRGITPPTLGARGLPPALRSLARRSPVPVELDVDVDRRLPQPIETALYYSVCEALTNVAKHARASTVEVHVRFQDTTVRLAVRDDGVGGADLRSGSGLLGLKDRVEALNGEIDVVSPAGGGTTVLIDIPIKQDPP